jgi:hypothetical protein
VGIGFRGFQPFQIKPPFRQYADGAAFCVSARDVMKARTGMFIIFETSSNDEKHIVYRYINLRTGKKRTLFIILET